MSTDTRLQAALKAKDWEEAERYALRAGIAPETFLAAVGAHLGLLNDWADEAGKFRFLKPQKDCCRVFGRTANFPYPTEVWLKYSLVFAKNSSDPNLQTYNPLYRLIGFPGRRLLLAWRPGKGGKVSASKALTVFPGR